MSTSSLPEKRSMSTQPTTVGTCATLACIWEATAPKPGNVYRGADFEDLTYVDFLTSAAVVGPILDKVADVGVGATVLDAVQHTRDAVATNTNLGLLLLMAPLAAVPSGEPLHQGIGGVLSSLDQRDTQLVYAAIRLAQPGGLGSVDQADVNSMAVPTHSLVDAMQLAADRDLVARQYTNDFYEVFQLADQIDQLVSAKNALGDSIVRAFVQLLANQPDSLIARKCGQAVAGEVSAHAAKTLDFGPIGADRYESALQEFDFSLRLDGHRRNPGTSADLIAAALFVLLRENRLPWPTPFYRNEVEKR